MSRAGEGFRPPPSSSLPSFASWLVMWPIAPRTGPITPHLWCKRGLFSVFPLLRVHFFVHPQHPLRQAAKTIFIPLFPPSCHWLPVRTSGGGTSHLQRKFSLCLSRPVVSSQLPGMLCREAPREGWLGCCARDSRKSTWKGYIFLSS